MTIACDAVAEQLCGVRLTGVVVVPPRLAAADRTDSDGRFGCGARTGAGAPSVITTSRSGELASDTAVGLSLLQAAANASAARRGTAGYLMGAVSTDRVPAGRCRGCPTSAARAVSKGDSRLCGPASRPGCLCRWEQGSNGAFLCPANRRGARVPVMWTQ